MNDGRADFSFEDRKRNAPNLEYYLNNSLSHSSHQQRGIVQSYISPFKIDLLSDNASVFESNSHKLITVNPKRKPQFSCFNSVILIQKERIIDMLNDAIQHEKQEHMSNDSNVQKDYSDNTSDDNHKTSPQHLLQNNDSPSFSLRHTYNPHQGKKNNKMKSHSQILPQKKDLLKGKSFTEVMFNNDNHIDESNNNRVPPNNMFQTTSLFVKAPKDKSGIKDYSSGNLSLFPDNSNSLLSFSDLPVKENNNSDKQHTILYNKYGIKLPHRANTSSSLQRLISKEILIKEWKERNYRRLQFEHYKVYDSVSEDEEDIEEPKWVIHPESTVNLIRYYVLIFFVLYLIIATPAYFVFGKDSSYYFIIIETMSDIFFVIDMIWAFFLPYPLNHLEKYEFDHKKIAWNYIATWAIIDFIALLPFNSITNYYSIKNLQRYELLKLLRIIKCLKLFLYSEQITKANLSSSSVISTSTTLSRLILFFVSFIILNHLLSCVWMYIGYITYPNWMTRLNIQDNTKVHIYFAAMYYNFSTIFTVGYGDIVPVSSYERYYNIILQSVGLFLYSFVVSSVMIIIKNTKGNVELDNKIAMLDSIKRKFIMSDKLYFKICKVLSFDYMLNNKRQFDLIESFPLSVKNAIINNMYKELVQFKFFRNTNYAFTSRIIMNLKEMTFDQKEIIIKENDFIDELIFVKRGRLSIESLYLGKVIQISQIFKGEHFGEVNMLLKTRSLFDIVVKSKMAVLYLLQRNILIEIASDCSDIINAKIETSLINMNLFKKKLRKKKKMIDNIQKSKTISNISKKEDVKSFHYETSIKEDNNNDDNIQIIEEESDNEDLNLFTTFDNNNRNDLSLISSMQDNKTVSSSKRKNSSSHCTSTLGHVDTNVTPQKKKNCSAFQVPHIFITPESTIGFTPGSIYGNKHKTTTILKNQTVITRNHNKINNKLRRNSMRINQNIVEGSLNMSEPSVFYSSLFNKLNVKDQIKQLKKGIHVIISIHHHDNMMKCNVI